MRSLNRIIGVMSNTEVSPSSAIEAATRRLSAALDARHEAVERRRDTDGDGGAARAQALSADRAKLAEQLDGSLARARMLERVNRDVAQKLDAAMATVRSMIEGAHAPGERPGERR